MKPMTSKQRPNHPGHNQTNHPKRFFLRAASTWFFGLPFIGLLPPAANANTHSQFHSDLEKTLTTLFATSQAAEDTSLFIDAAQEAENPGLVPIKVTAQGAQSIAVFLQPASDPLIIAATFEPGSDPSLTFTANMEQGTTILCYALRGKQLFRNARTIRTSQNGYTN